MSRSLVSIIALALMALLAFAAARPSCAQIATWYGRENGPQTASGERFDPDGYCSDYAQASCTCAHPSLPFGIFLKVSWHRRSVVCRVTDRGPASWTGADLDLSMSAARQLGMIEAGRAHVRIERAGPLE